MHIAQTNFVSSKTVLAQTPPPQMSLLLIFAVLFVINTTTGQIVHKYVEFGETKFETLENLDRPDVSVCRVVYDAIYEHNTRHYEFGMLTNATSKRFFLWLIYLFTI